jgi:D-threonate/D-erythronate kinase
MFKNVVIADDLTGANATCALLKKLGLRVSSLFRLEPGGKYDADVLAYSTDSRGVSAEEAYTRVKNAVRQLRGTDVFYNKRIDSTLRGNIGAEIDAVLDGLEDSRTAIVVPAYPDSGRIVLNRTMLVNGVLLMNSDAGKDPKMPIHTNDVESIIGTQTRHPYSYITLEEVSKGVKHISELLKEHAKSSRIIIFDAVRNEDIMHIAQAAVRSNLQIVTVDPGPFTMYYMREQQICEKTEQKVLMVIGSVTDTTRQQMEYILQERKIFLLQMDVACFFDEMRRRQEIERAVASICSSVDEEDLFMLTTTPLGNQEMLDLEAIARKINISMEDVSKILSNTLAETAARILLESQKFEGIYSSGGDVTISLLEHLGAVGVDVRDEVIPLAVYGRLIGGSLADMKLITKGGMVGNHEAIRLCLNKMTSDYDQ